MSHKANEKRYIEDKRIYDAIYHAANREKHLISMAAYRSTHKEENKSYRITHKESIQANATIRRKKFPDKIRQSKRATYAKNPQKVLSSNKRYRAKKRGAQIQDFTANQWQAMQIAYDHRCIYCGKRCKGRLTQDHITPLSEGGNHTLSNIVPACQSCNSKKYVGPPLKPIQHLLLLIQ